MVSLDNLLKILPLETSLLFDLAYPSGETISLFVLTRQDLNAFVDSVLEKIFDVSDQLETQLMRRKITFTSFSSDVCSALNWKQPNYPVFLGTICGKESENHISVTALGSGRGEKRVSSIGAAIEFAKANNLLGLLMDSDLLAQVPSLADGIRSSELIVGVYGSAQTLTSLRGGSSAPEGESGAVDALFSDGVISFIDRSKRESG